MNKKFLVLLLALCLTLSVFTLAVGAEEVAAEATSSAPNVWVIISLAVAGAAVIAAVVICIIKRKAVAAFFKAYKGEVKKITWYSGKNVVRGTVFVVVTLVIIAIVVALLDFAFMEGQTALVSAVSKIKQ